MAEVLKMSGEGPSPRFGHTVTLVSKSLAILFGGAIGDTGKYNITGDTYSCDVLQKKWKKLNPTGQPPNNRAAHQSVCIDSLQLVIFGGAVGGGGLADDNLYALDLRRGEDQAGWLQIPVVGNTPGRRYGHTMSFIKPHLLVYGGNTGAEPVNDVWCLNLERAPYNWAKLECGNEQPNVRVYHSAAMCNTGSANGMMVIFGGRTNDQSALNDTWGLRRHRDGRWDWVRAPYRANGELPTQRYQHQTIFLGSLMFVLGGRSNHVGETLPFEIYDTESSDWYKFNAIQRFRHSLWSIENFLYIHGGFDPETPNIPTDVMLRLDLNKLFINHPQLMKCVYAQQKRDETQGVGLPDSTNNYNKTGTQPTSMQQQMGGTVNNFGGYQQPSHKLITISQNVHIAHIGPDDETNQSIQKILLENLQDENKKIKTVQYQPSNMNKNIGHDQLVNVFLQLLMIPAKYPSIQANHNFFAQINKDFIFKLCDEVQKIFEREPRVLQCSPPIKILGDIKGQFGDLMRMFRNYGHPSDQGEGNDIDANDYLFLGNYIDRGTRSLETILLLFATKVKYSDHIYMLRGPHEDKNINKNFGFADECANKFQEDPFNPNSVYNRINKVFEYMPLAAVIDNQIYCVHGGIGKVITNIEHLSQMIPKQLEIKHDAKTYQEQIVLDTLWSDPSYNEDDPEQQPDPEHDYFGLKIITRFSTDRIQKFLTDNKITMIIRSGEPVMSGWERMKNNICTVYSCTDYCGITGNSADIQPLQSQNYSEEKWFNLEDQLMKRRNNKQFQDEDFQLRKRPPTPPRRNRNF